MNNHEIKYFKKRNIKYKDDRTVKEKKQDSERASRLEKHWGMTLSDYNNLVESQNYVCCICKNSNGDKYLVIDHCHTSGKVRGLLCSSCNSGLGFFKDNIESLWRAIDYLQTWDEKDLGFIFSKNERYKTIKKQGFKNSEFGKNI